MKALFATIMLAVIVGASSAVLRADPSPAVPVPSTVSAPAATPASLALPSSPAITSSPATAASLPLPPTSPASAATLTSLADPQLGQPESAVYSALGKPMGRILLPDKAVLLMYNRGDVTIRNGVVSAVRLLDEAAYAAKSAKEAAFLAQRVKEQAHLATLRKSFLTDPGYLSLATRDRLTALQRFDQQYPGSGIRDDYDALMAVYEAEMAAQTQLADLQKRLTDAEQQTAAAEQAVADAQQQAANAQQQAAAAEASAAMQNNQPSGFIGNTIVATGGYDVYYVGSPYGHQRWGNSLHPRVVQNGGNGTVTAPQSTGYN